MDQGPHRRGEKSPGSPTPTQLERLARILGQHPQVSGIELRWEEYRGTEMVTAYVIAADPFVVPRLARLRESVTGDELRRWLPRRLKLVRLLPSETDPAER